MQGTFKSTHVMRIDIDSGSSFTPLCPFLSIWISSLVSAWNSSGESRRWLLSGPERRTNLLRFKYDSGKFFHILGFLRDKFGMSAFVSGLWQPAQYWSRTGWTSRTKEYPRTGAMNCFISDGRFLAAIAGAVDGVIPCPSWQPTQLCVSPGITVNQLRMSASALPSASSG